jgi:AbrB family transcriptional regulator, transcriptional pleiotropic regulator of transition state genes
VKTTGMLRGFDKAGRFVLPAEMIRTLDIAPTDMLEISCDGTQIILRKHNPFCFTCGETNGKMIEINHKKICEKCAVKVASGLDG